MLAATRLHQQTGPTSAQSYLFSAAGSVTVAVMSPRRADIAPPDTGPGTSELEHAVDRRAAALREKPYSAGWT